MSSGSHSSVTRVHKGSRDSLEQVDTQAFVPAHVPPPNHEVPPSTDEAPEGVQVNPEDGSNSKTHEALNESTKARDGGSLQKTFIVPSSL